MIEFANSRMTNFLKLFGIEEGNGLSPFCCSISSPAELKSLITQFFKPPKKDNRGYVVTGTQVIVDVESEDEDEDEDQIDDSNDGVTDSSIDSLSPEIIAEHVSFINGCPSDVLIEDIDEDSNSHDDGGDTVSNDAGGDTVSNDAGGNCSLQCLSEFMNLLNCTELGQISTCSLKLIQLLDLGKIDSGSIASQSKYMTRNQRWFKAEEGDTNNSDEVEVDAPQGKFVTRNSLIQLSCARGKTNTSVEYYCVQSFFTKTYNKWYMSVEGKFSTHLTMLQR